MFVTNLCLVATNLSPLRGNVPFLLFGFQKQESELSNIVSNDRIFKWGQLICYLLIYSFAQLFISATLVMTNFQCICYINWKDLELLHLLVLTVCIYFLFVTVIYACVPKNSVLHELVIVALARPRLYVCMHTVSLNMITCECCDVMNCRDKEIHG